MPEIMVEMTNSEASALHTLSRETEMPQCRVFIQALRLYYQNHCRLKAGETCAWSGDAQRARDFAGPLAESDD